MLIGIAGVKGSGKTTATQMALNIVRGGERFSFAGILKEMLAVLGLNYEQLYGSEKETPCDLLCGHTPRWAMQSLGTEWGRNLIGEDIWIRAMRAKLVTRLPYNPIIVDDVRYPNEVGMLRELNAYIWRINRRDTITGNHSSETEIANLSVDAEISNDGTMFDLRARIEALIIGM